MHTEMKALVIQDGDGISGDLIGQFTNRFPHQIIGLGEFGAGEMAGYAHCGLGIEIEDDSTLDVTGKRDQRGHTFAPVGFLLHAEVPNGHGRLQALGQDGVRRVYERLDQLHLHC